MSDDDAETLETTEIATAAAEPETKTVAVRIPAEYHKALRRIGVEHGLDNTQVILWSLDLLVRYERDGGVYAGR